MKNINFLKGNYFANGGLYDNLKTFENTIESYNAAITKKFGIYVTIRETKDHEYICYSDEDLTRTHNLKDKVSEITYEELSYLSFYHIPKLEEFINLISNKVPIIFNLNTHKNKEVLNILNNYNNEFAIVSKDNRLLSSITKKYPHFIIGEIITKRSFNITSLLIKSDFKSYNIHYFDSAKLKKLKESNLPVIGYIINTKDKYLTYKNEFDNIIIDNYYNLELND